MLLLLLALSCPLHADGPPSIETLVRDLGDRRYKVRVRAAATLGLIVDPEHPAVKRALTKGTLEQKRVLERLIERRSPEPRPGVTDATLTALARHPELTALDLTGCVKITGQGLAAVGKLPRLRRLSLGGCRIRTADLARLGPQLEHLDLSGCAVDVSGLRLPRLRTFRAPPGIDARQLRQLVAASPKLTRLDLSDCPKLTDAALDALAGLAQLEWLDLSGWRVGSMRATSFMLSARSLLPSASRRPRNLR